MPHLKCSCGSRDWNSDYRARQMMRMVHIRCRCSCCTSHQQGVDLHISIFILASRVCHLGREGPTWVMAYNILEHLGVPQHVVRIVVPKTSKDYTQVEAMKGHYDDVQQCQCFCCDPYQFVSRQRLCCLGHACGAHMAQESLPVFISSRAISNNRM